MNDPHDNDTKLLAAAFHDDWSEGRTADFARAAAAHARGRRRIRRTLSTAGVGTVLTVAAFVTLRSTPPTLPSHAANPPATAAPGYEIISDEQLLAQLRDRPILVVRAENGSREIVVLAKE